MDTGYLGTDIAFVRDFDMQAAGDTALSSGLDCLAQDLIHALTTPKGDLWYAPAYGVDVYRYLKAENTQTQRLALEQEIEITLEADPRVVTGSARAAVTAWDLHSIRIEASLRPCGQSNRLNMVMGYAPNAFEAGVI